MAEFVVSAKLIADASGMKAGAADAKAALQEVSSAADASGKSATAATAPLAAITKGHGNLVVSAKQAANAQRQLGVQLNDLGTQLALGASPAQAFSAQIGQIGFAMAQMGGKVGQIGALLAGPFGAAVAIGSAVLGGLVSTLFDAEKQTDKTKGAVDLHKLSVEELTDAIKEEKKAAEESIRTSKEARTAALAAALAKQNEAKGRLEVAAAALEEASAERQAQLARLRGPSAGREDPTGARALTTIAEIGDLRAQINALRIKAGDAQGAAAARAVDLAQTIIDTSPAQRAEEKRNREASNRYFDALRRAGDDVGAQRRALNELTQALVRSKKQRDEDDRKDRESKRRPRRGDVHTITGADVDEILADLGLRPNDFSGARSASRNRAVGGAANSRHLRSNGGLARDIPVAIARRLGITRDTLREAFDARGIQLAELLGPGDKGHGDHFHVAPRTGQLGGNFDRASRARERIAREAKRKADKLKREAEERLRLAEFGDDAGRRIDRLTGRLGDTPPAVEASRNALAQLDDLLEDIEERKPPNIDALREQAAAARPVIEDSINRPFRDFIESQQESLGLLRLEATGRRDIAEAQQSINRLEREQGPLGEARKDAVLATVQALQAEERQLDILRQKQGLYIGTLRDVRGTINGTIEDVLGGNLSALTDLPKRLSQTFNRLIADTLTERLFGDAFRRLEDQVTGTRIVEDASERLAAAMERLGQESASSLKPLDDSALKASDTLGDFTGAIIRATAAINGETVAEPIVVTGRRLPPLLPPGFGADDGTRPASKSPQQFFRDMLNDLLGSVFGRSFASLVSKAITQGLEGSAIGSIVGGTARSLGLPVNQTGATIGGALGNIAGTALKKTITSTFGKAIGSVAGPIGSVLGSLGGGLIGSLFSGSKRASATLTSVGGQPSVTGKSSLRGAASALGQAVQDGVAQIAESLGGTLGGFSVSIGKRGDKFRVDPSGSGKTKGGGVLSFNTEAEAVAAAVLDAIRDGAVQGLSAAVQRALGSSPDANKALREALKVQDVEDLLSSIGAETSRAFRQFEQQARERLRIAREYGFDVLRIEKINAEERAKLTEQVLSARIGDLKQLLNDINFGDLFEGSLSDRRTRLIAELDAATRDAEAGKEGAAQRQASLSRDLIALSREAFGTAGPEFAADRAQAISAAERVIQLENERVKRAQEGQDKTNEHLDEANDQRAQVLAKMDQQTALLEGISVGISAGPIFQGANTFREAVLR